MAVKGQVAKQQVTQEILKYFGDKAFIYDKDIRVNWVEDGQPCQIKITLTASKVAVEQGGDAAVPGDVVSTTSAISKVETGNFNDDIPVASAPVAAPTEQEKIVIKALLEKLGL